MVDPVVQRLLEDAIDTPVKLQLLLMFHEHPRMQTTAATIADRVCRDIWSVAEALQQLADDGVLMALRNDRNEPTYCYAPKAELLEAIQRLLRDYDNPMERDKLQRSIRDLASYGPYRRANRWAMHVA
jgi:predicted transcriptional regulator